jgi:FMN-dependent NADH-azoreductase
MRPCLLHIDASARRASYSRRASAAYADAWQIAHPDGKVTRRDLASSPVPFIDETWTEVDDIVVSGGLSDLDEISSALADPRHRASWARTRPLLEELLAADTILIGTPMYNWSIPASLKAWIDHITFPFVSLDGRRVVVCTARGGSYPPDWDDRRPNLQEPYLRTYFGRLDVSDITFVHSDYTLAGVMPLFSAYTDRRDEMHAAAIARAAALADDTMALGGG